MLLLSGTCPRNSSRASSPPADAPMPTIKNELLLFVLLAGLAIVAVRLAMAGALRAAADGFLAEPGLTGLTGLTGLSMLVLIVDKSA